MTKYLRSALFIGIFSIIIGSASTSYGQILPDILKRMDAYNKDLTSVTANVTMVKTDSAINVSETKTGTTSYIPKTAKIAKGKNYARIDWETRDGRKFSESVSVIGDSYELYSPGQNIVYQGTVNKAKGGAAVGGALGFMNMSRAQLSANYTVVYIGEEKIKDNTTCWHLQLTPKTASGYKTADLWVDGNGAPRHAKIIENNNDSTTVLLERMKTNDTLNASIFRLSYPNNTTKKKV